MGKSGARSSGPTGCPVPGCRIGCIGFGMSARTLYQRLGSSDSASRNLVCATARSIIARSVRRAPARELRERDREHEGTAVEELLDERLHAEQLQPRDAGDEEVDGRDRADRVEPPRNDRRRAQERCSERRQEEAEAGCGVGRAERAGVEDAGEGADQAGDDESTPPEPGDVDAAQPRDAPAATDEEEPPPD